MNIDIRTLVFVLGVTHLLQTAIFYYQYKTIKQYQGIGWWFLWSIAELLAFSFMLLRGIPAIQTVSIFLQNSLLILGLIFLYVGIMRFFEQKENRQLIYSLYALFCLTLLYYLLVDDRLHVRSIIIAGSVAVFSLFSVHALLAYRPKALTSAATFTASVFLVHSCFFLFRFGVLLTISTYDWLGPSPLNIATYLDALICSIALTFVFTVMINHRLNTEMREAKEEMETVFNTIPDAALISRLSDGLVVYANDGFREMSGYDARESIGRFTTELSLWRNPADRQKFARELAGNGSAANFETLFQRKDHSQLNGLISAKVISLHEVPHVISVTKDITPLKNKEAELNEAIVKLQKALEEIQTLKGIVPICMYCKGIRDDQGYWNQLEKYISDHTGAQFSHGICDNCLEKYQ